MSEVPEKRTARLKILRHEIRSGVVNGFECRGEFMFVMDNYDGAKAIAERMEGLLVGSQDSIADEAIGVLRDKVTLLQQQLLDKERAYNNRVVEMTQKISMLEQQLIHLHRLELEIEELSMAVAPRPQLHA